MRRLLLVLVIVLSVALVVGVLFWYFIIYQKPGTKIAPQTTTKPTPGVGFGNLSPNASLCAKFQKTESKISCEEAVEKALKQAQGNVINISIESIRTTIPNSSPPTRETIGIWAVDIKLNKPLFIKETEKEAQILRIGIPMNGNDGIYKKAIE